MDYKKWNKAISEYYFNADKEEKEVILDLSESLIEEIGQRKFPKPENGYINDFYEALRNDLNDVGFVSRAEYHHQEFNVAMNHGAIPLTADFLTYLLVFILPFTSRHNENNYNSNNFHDVVDNFFTDKGLIANQNYLRDIRNNFSIIDQFWSTLQNWLIEKHSFSIGYIEQINPPQNRRFVGKFKYHILLRKEKEDLLTVVFSENDLYPGQLIDEKEMRNIILKNNDLLRLPAETMNLIRNNDVIGQKIIARVIRIFNRWDGAVRILNNGDAQRPARVYSRDQLVLCLDYNRLQSEIRLNNFRIYSKRDFPSNCKLQDEHGNIIDGIFQARESYSNRISYHNINLSERIRFEDRTNNIRFSWQPKDILLFKRIDNFDWVQVERPDFMSANRIFLILVKKEFFNLNLAEWYENIIPDEKKRKSDDSWNGVPQDWILLRIEDLPKYPHENIDVLRAAADSESYINFDREFYKNGCFYNFRLPKVWLENKYAENGINIDAVYTDGTIIALDRNTSEDEGGSVFFSFNHNHKEKLDLDFKLRYGNIVTRRFYRIINPVKNENTEIDKLLPLKNRLGQSGEQTTDFIKGTEAFFSNDLIEILKPQQNLLFQAGIFNNNRRANGFAANGYYDESKSGNVLLSYLSSRGSVTKSEFNKMVYSLVADRCRDRDLSREANLLRSYLIDLGFIDYTPESSQITINKPSLFIIPSDTGVVGFLTGARDPDFIRNLLAESQTCGIHVCVSDYRESDFMPQRILLKHRDPDICNLARISEEHGIICIKDGLHQQFAMANFFEELKNWDQYIKKIENQMSDFNGGLIFDINILEFTPKPDNFDKDIAFIKYQDINGYQTLYRLWYENDCYKIENQQLGIYLYIFLYRKYFTELCQNPAAMYDAQPLNTQRHIRVINELTNIILTDTQRKKLYVPLNCRLPRYLSVAVSLLSGKIPEIINHQNGVQGRNLTYLVYSNVPSLFILNTLTLKLGQQPKQFN